MTSPTASITSPNISFVEPAAWPVENSFCSGSPGAAQVLAGLLEALRAALVPEGLLVFLLAGPNRVLGRTSGLLEVAHTELLQVFRSEREAVGAVLVALRFVPGARRSLELVVRFLVSSCSGARRAASGRACAVAAAPDGADEAQRTNDN